VTWLTDKLGEAGIIAAPLSGLSSKEDRTEIMRRLQDGRLGAVVTTEMAARGLDVARLTHVVNYDLPTDADHYVHRAGRCGRAGRPGIVINVTPPETKFVLGKFAGKLGLSFADAEVKDSKLWLVKRPPDASGSGGGSDHRNGGGGGSDMAGRPPWRGGPSRGGDSRRRSG
ncbi:unnamed protein product, partial [Phaeothamnion confervicola]